MPGGGCFAVSIAVPFGVLLRPAPRCIGRVSHEGSPVAVIAGLGVPDAAMVKVECFFAGIVALLALVKLGAAPMMRVKLCVTVPEGFSAVMVMT